jgi:hypothetical protein
VAALRISAAGLCILQLFQASLSIVPKELFNLPPEKKEKIAT